MSYMKQVAEILGVQLNEVFYIEEISGGFVLTDNGLFHEKDNRQQYSVLTKLLVELLTGIYTIEKRPWKPEKRQIYWCVSNNGLINYHRWYNDEIDITFYKIGNCYRTIEEAKNTLKNGKLGMKIINELMY